MVPSAFVCLSAWPLNSSGKVDRGKLPVPETGDADSEHVGPRTAQEAWVSAVVAEAMGMDVAPSIHCDLLSMGLTSLVAVRVSSLLSQRHGATVGTVSILQHRTIAGIASSIAECSEDDNKHTLVRRDRAAEDEPLALSYEQEQMWVLYQLDPSSGAYNCLLYTSPSPRDGLLYRMPSSA